MNKADRLYPLEELPIINGDRIYMSAREGTGIEELCDMISSRLEEDMLRLSLLIPYQDAGKEFLISAKGEILEKEYTDKGIELLCLIGRRYIKDIKEYIRL